MKLDRMLHVAIAGAALVMIVAAPARAQSQAVEIGTSLATFSVGLGDDDLTTFGVPATGFGSLNPGVYASIFLGQRMSVEPQIGLLVASGGDGGTFHLVNVAGQVNYFLKDIGLSSPYVFGSVGIVDASGGDTSPLTFGVGAGYRMRVGSRLTFRFDGRFTHVTDDGIDAVAFTVSIGGVFGR
jgi:hypothetical protein